ncbi:MAG: succinylglutamate desuccinylase/aspartoacylase family protein [Planctomycetota bacterium]
MSPTSSGSGSTRGGARERARRRSEASRAPLETSLTIGGASIAPGETRDLTLSLGPVSALPPLEVPVRVVRGLRPGPRLFVLALVHGDELNGLGVLRRLMSRELRLLKGTLLLVPVANPYSFFSHSRYLPDHRDLNRCFPGKNRGSAASRLAALLFREIVAGCDAGIDLHTAPRGRTNAPHVRVSLEVRGARALARQFGAEILLDHPSRPGTLRHAAAGAGIPVLLVEAGDPFRFQPQHIRWMTMGVLNVLRSHGMIEGAPVRAPFRVIIKRTRWLRAEAAGILEMTVKPRQLVRAGTPLGRLFDVFGGERMTIRAPEPGLVLGVTTYPAASVGDALCHLGVAKRSWSLLEKHLGAALG